MDSGVPLHSAPIFSTRSPPEPRTSVLLIEPQLSYAVTFFALFQTISKRFPQLPRSTRGEMARGNQRDKAREKNQKESAAQKKKNTVR
ncbi:MAG: hypothetical protein Q9228_006309 [Teloschistes exilis]